MIGRALLVGLLLLAQANRPAIKTQTDLVALNVTVTDSHGIVVRNLTRDAFVVTEDGVPQPIVQFAAESVPLTLVVALDASTSMLALGSTSPAKPCCKCWTRSGPMTSSS